MGTWERGSHWSYRLLEDYDDPWQPVFVLGKGKREGKGGDVRRLAQEETTGIRGRTFVFRLGTDTRKDRPRRSFYYPEPRKIKLSLCLRQREEEIAEKRA